MNDLNVIEVASYIKSLFDEIYPHSAFEVRKDVFNKWEVNMIMTSCGIPYKHRYVATYRDGHLSNGWFIYEPIYADKRCDLTDEESMKQIIRELSQKIQV